MEVYILGGLFAVATICMIIGIFQQLRNNRNKKDEDS